MEINADYKKGFIDALKGVFHVLMENMGEEEQDLLLSELNLKRV
jgi:hypothetical protein